MQNYCIAKLWGKFCLCKVLKQYKLKSRVRFEVKVLQTEQSKLEVGVIKELLRIHEIIDLPKHKVKFITENEAALIVLGGKF